MTGYVIFGSKQEKYSTTNQIMRWGLCFSCSYNQLCTSELSGNATDRNDDYDDDDCGTKKHVES